MDNREDEYFRNNFNNFRKDVLALLWEFRHINLTVQDISNRTDTDYGYCNRIISEFEDKNLISRRRISRKKVIELTSEGKELASKIHKLYECLTFLEDRFDRYDKKQDSPD